MNMTPGQPLTDKGSGASQSIAWPHHNVQRGTSFNAHFSNVTANTDDHRTAIGFSTPNTTNWIHLVVAISASDPAEFFLLEAPTIDDDDGGNIVVYNRHRNIATTSGLLSLEAPGVANRLTSFTEAQMVAATFSGGLEIEYVALAAGSSPQAVGGVARASQEWVLDQNSKYLLMLKNTAANINTHLISMNWYENTNKE